MAERFASVSEDELWEKCIIKQLLLSLCRALWRILRAKMANLAG